MRRKQGVTVAASEETVESMVQAAFLLGFGDPAGDADFPVSGSASDRAGWLLDWARRVDTARRLRGGRPVAEETLRAALAGRYL